MKKLLLVALACTASSVVQAQTGRIAHFSHGGSVAALVIAAKVDDNLGTPIRMETEWRRDTLVVINELRVEHRGEARSWMAGTEREQAAWYRKVEVWHQSVFDEETLLAYHKQRPAVVLTGLDKIKTVSIQPTAAGRLSQALRDASYALEHPGPGTTYRFGFNGNTYDFFAVDTVRKLTDSTAVQKEKQLEASEWARQLCRP